MCEDAHLPLHAPTRMCACVEGHVNKWTGARIRVCTHVRGAYVRVGDMCTKKKCDARIVAL